MSQAGFDALFHALSCSAGASDFADSCLRAQKQARCRTPLTLLPWTTSEHPTRLDRALAFARDAGVCRSARGARLSLFFGYDLPGGLDRRQRLVSQRAEAQCRRRSIYELLRAYPIANGYPRITSDKPDSLVA